MSDNVFISRREAIALAAAAAAGSLAARRLLAQPSSHGLVIRNERPLDAEAPLGALARWETDADLFFVRSHFGPPTRAASPFRLEVVGDVERPLSLSLAALRRLGSERRPVTLECAGNGRGVFALPKTSGVQWGYGAVSNATWTGVPLGELLERAGARPGALHFWTEAADQAPLGKVPKFLRSIPRDVALGDAFVAWEMNGRPIPTLHGGPVRLIVPGWFGMASTKWLTRIHAKPVESDNFYMATGYRYPDRTPVQAMRVKSVIAAPLEGARVRVGRVAVRGKAWSGAGAGGIRAVEVTADGGRTWRPARLVGAERPGAWRAWEAEVEAASPGPQRVAVRATDRSGAVQPERAEPNAPGYGNNSWHEVRYVAVAG
ncbi:MAG: sulfite oxidase [Gemmatimonadaceae bacterium]